MPHEELDAASTKAEGGLSSEAGVIEEQARQAQPLKDRENLLKAPLALLPPIRIRRNNQRDNEGSLRMMTKLRVWWQAMRESFWFVPSLILAAGIALALGLIEADATVSKQWMDHWPRLFGAGADGARVMLSTIAGSMMTVVGMTFSMTLVTLALASSQYTSRILRNFMRDRVTQVVLGMFAGTFTYCLVVLRTIRGGDEGGFVPNLAVLFGVVLAIGGIGVLIFFIHHIASSIQASSIIASVAEETIEAVDRLFPAALGHRPADNEEDQAVLHLPERTWQAIPAGGNGYIQSVDDAALLRWAREHQTIVRMERGIGEFVFGDALLASVALENPPEKNMIAALQAAYTINRHRTVQQDAASASDRSSTSRCERSHLASTTPRPP